MKTEVSAEQSTAAPTLEEKVGGLTETKEATSPSTPSTTTSATEGINEPAAKAGQEVSSRSKICSKTIPSEVPAPKYINLKDGRPTFSFEKKEVRAGGVLYCRRMPKEPFEILLKTNFNSEKQTSLEDLGGKTSLDDATFLDTIARKVEEESSGGFSKERVKRQIEGETPIYIHGCKYVMYIIVLEPSEVPKTLPPNVNWHSLLYVQRYQERQLNVRLNETVLNKLSELMALSHMAELKI